MSNYGLKLATKPTDPLKHYQRKYLKSSYRCHKILQKKAMKELAEKAVSEKYAECLNKIKNSETLTDETISKIFEELFEHKKCKFLLNSDYVDLVAKSPTENLRSEPTIKWSRLFDK